jgi:hypothetical protein
MSPPARAFRFPRPPGLSFYRRELMLSLLLTGGVAMGLFLLAATAVLWDPSLFRESMAALFQIELADEDLRPETNRPHPDSAEAFARDVLATRERSLFDDAADPGEGPRPEAAPPRPTPAGPPESALAPGRSGGGALGAPWGAVRGAAHEAVPIAQPSVARREAQRPLQRVVPAIRGEYERGRLGRRALGTPGETVFSIEPEAMPAPPASPALAPAPPGPTRFHLPPGAGPVMQRLVADRPPAGYPALDDAIRADFDVYRPPGAASAVFRLTLSLREGAALPRIPKNALFLIDISQSIPLEELRRVREAVTTYLAQLPAEDGWNVVLFSEALHWLHEGTDFVPAAAFDREAVADFIDKRPGQRRTNVFEATRAILERLPASPRPCNVFLVSDGRANTVTSEVSRIVRGFRRVNRERFSLFSFDAGGDGNLFLLSLLSYRSRGQFTTVPDLERVAARLLALCTRFEDPVLTNVVSNYANLEPEETVPEVLPNLYRGAPIVIWGRARPGREVAMRVAGMGAEGPRELFFRATVPDADTAGEALLREWAEGKAFSLVAEWVDEPENEPLRARIESLARTHGLPGIAALVEKRRSFLTLPWDD